MAREGERTYVLLLYFPVDAEVKCLCDIGRVFGATQGPKRDVALVTIAAIQVCLVNDLPLDYISTITIPSREREKLTSFSPLFSPYCRTML